MFIYYQLHLIFVSAFWGKTVVFKSGRYKNSVELYSVVANYNLYTYTTDKFFQCRKYIGRCILINLILIKLFKSCTFRGTFYKANVQVTRCNFLWVMNLSLNFSRLPIYFYHNTSSTFQVLRFSTSWIFRSQQPIRSFSIEILGAPICAPQMQSFIWSFPCI